MISAAAGGGFANLSYQWTRNGVPLQDGVTAYGSTITGAHSEALAIANVVFADQGSYRLEVTDGCGTVTSNVSTLTLTSVAATPGEAGASVFLYLGPNPASGPSVLAFSLAREARVSYSVYDLRGRRVRHLDLGTLPAGHFEERWDSRDDGGRDVAAGIYFVSLELDGQRLGARRLTLVR